MQADTMVNFRVPTVRYRAWQREATRRSQTLSAFLRGCIDDACERAVAEEKARSAWREDLPDSVRGLVGIVPPAPGGSYEDARADYYDHLAAKYA